MIAPQLSNMVAEDVRCVAEDGNFPEFSVVISEVLPGAEIFGKSVAEVQAEDKVSMKPKLGSEGGFGYWPDVNTRAAPKQASLDPALPGAVEMKVTTKKGPNFYAQAALNLLKGVEAKEAESDKEAVDAKPPVDALRITGLGAAISIAITAAMQCEDEGVGEIVRTQTAFPVMENTGRGCPQIIIDLKRLDPDANDDETAIVFEDVDDEDDEDDEDDKDDVDDKDDEDDEDDENDADDE